VVIDRVDWKSQNTPNGVGFVRKCAVYKLPQTACEGRRVLYYNHHNAISILQHPFPLGTNAVGDNVPPGSPSTNAEFWNITLSAHDDIVELEWIDYNHGWTIIRQEGHVQVQSLRAVSPKYIYSLCTLRRMNGDYETNYGVKVAAVTPPNVPIVRETNKSMARDWVSVVDLDPSSVNYGKIVYKAFGSIPFSSIDEENAEYHHGDLLHIQGTVYIAAPSLSSHQSYIDVFSLDSLGAPTLSGVITPKQAAIGEISAYARDSLDPQSAAFHTTHQNHQTGKILISHLGTAQYLDEQPTRDSAPGGFVELSEDVKTFALERYYQNNDAVVGGPALQTITNYQKLTGLDANGVAYSPYKAASLVSTLTGVVLDIDDTYQYDFTINDCENTLVCTSWGPPSSFDKGFSPDAPYGRTIRVLKMPDEQNKQPHNPEQPAGMPPNLTVAQTFATSMEDGDGLVPLEVRRTHVPGQEIYFVGVTLPGAIDVIYKDGNVWKKKVVIDMPTLVAHCTNPVVTDAPDAVPLLSDTQIAVPLVTDITLSEDDRFLYVSCWLAGVLLQYDVRDPFNPVLVGGLGNLGGVTVVAPSTNVPRTDSYVFDNSDPQKPKTYAGGPQMLRLDPAGYNLYVTNSLFSSWDDEFFPQGSPAASNDGSLLTNGGMMIKLDTGVRRGKKQQSMSIDKTFGTNGVIPYKNLQFQARSKSGDYENITFTSRVHESHIIGVRH